jgi:uncharacterized membrane protein YqjE
MSLERPMSVVLQDIVRNVQDIVRSEVRLAKTEVAEELRGTRSVAVLLAMGALSGLFTVLFGLVACVCALSLVLPMWAASVGVAAFAGIVATVTICAGLARFKTIRAAPKSVASIKENVEWAKQQIR